MTARSASVRFFFISLLFGVILLFLAGLGVLGHEVFEILGMVGDALGTEESAAVLGDQQVVLNTDATEILVGLEFVEIKELLTMSLFPPKVDKMGDEVDTGFVGQYKALFQFATHTQTISAELFKVRTRFVIEPYVDLS
jgi:hypothetical protein